MIFGYGDEKTPPWRGFFYYIKLNTMRSIWTGAIGFGLVNIPIKMYSAVQGSELDLDMLDKKDHANIKFKRVNEHTGKEGAWARGVAMHEKIGAPVGEEGGKFVAVVDSVETHC